MTNFNILLVLAASQARMVQFCQNTHSHINNIMHIYHLSQFSNLDMLLWCNGIKRTMYLHKQRST